jgi:hypothetical protein
MGDQIKGLLIAIILGGIVAVVLLQIGRWLPNTCTSGAPSSRPCS